MSDFTDEALDIGDVASFVERVNAVMAEAQAFAEQYKFNCEVLQSILSGPDVDIAPTAEPEQLLHDVERGNDRKSKKITSAVQPEVQTVDVESLWQQLSDAEKQELAETVVTSISELSGMARGLLRPSRALLKRWAYELGIHYEQFALPEPREKEVVGDISLDAKTFLTVEGLAISGGVDMAKAIESIVYTAVKVLRDETALDDELLDPNDVKPIRHDRLMELAMHGYIGGIDFGAPFSEEALANYARRSRVKARFANQPYG